MTGRPAAQRGLQAVLTVVTVLALLVGLPLPSGVAVPEPDRHPAPAAVPGTGPVEPGEPAWEWPVAGPPRLLRPFDPPAQRWGRGHRGVDLLAPAGGPVRAVADGVVSYSGEIAGIGVVAVRHAGGLRSTYQPVTDRVATGQLVRAGDLLGTLAPGHCLLLTCLHLGAVSGRDSYHDPMLLLRGWRVRLLPLRPAGGPGPRVSDSWAPVRG